MDLKTFIKNTITSISEALVEAQNELSSKGVIINPEKVEIGKNGEKLLRSDGWRYVQNLDFDILVAVEEGEGAKGGAGLNVAGLISIGGELSESNKNQQSNRIKFIIPVAFPTNKTPDEYKSNKGNYSIG
ncbi:hypothetical protein BH09BAC5_BH09BAC5_07620 [soil metagenome]